ncbi:hypothetical protein [Defluviimonas salinarum]|uniref:Secreted protein n=1 Tax=Defluviimonas salinarum TaxID=2992147 RepID=A0ABT3J867_9RHOB|nr:hypothetical protein [Defluviimonas salinarum]MCW3783886.1 hypothetical protein [Defluviimonas salinarum]
MLDAILSAAVILSPTAAAGAWIIFSGRMAATGKTSPDVEVPATGSVRHGTLPIETASRREPPVTTGRGLCGRAAPRDVPPDGGADIGPSGCGTSDCGCD